MANTENNQEYDDCLIKILIKTFWCIGQPIKNMEKITTLSQINKEIPEGRLLLAALAKITTESQTDKEPDEVIQQCEELAEEMDKHRD